MTKRENKQKENIEKIKKKRKKVFNKKNKEDRKKSKKDNINENESYTSKELITVMLFSLGIGFIMCFGCISLITGKNYIRVKKDLDKIIDTYYAIVDNYYGDLDKDALIDGAVEGMIYSVGDSFTSYSNTDDTTEFNETITGSYEGIGCSIATYTDGKTIVIEVFNDSPAEKAGLQVGDIITKVDGKDYTDKSSNEISEYVKNSGKEKVTLTIERENKEMDITINLSKVEIPYVISDTFENNDKKVGYIQISLFSSNSYKQFNKQLDKLEKEGIDSLIIDVRDNAGGYLTSVTDICSLFLEKGKIIYSLEDSDGTIKKKDITKEKRTYNIAVLINEESASASEILASAIKESYGGLVVGTNSYGKGTVQQTKKLLDGSMIKYTTQKWLTPNGNFINEIGVTPTDVIEMNEDYYSNPNYDNDNQLQSAIKLLTK